MNLNDLSNLKKLDITTLRERYNDNINDQQSFVAHYQRNIHFVVDPVPVIEYTCNQQKSFSRSENTIVQIQDDYRIYHQGQYVEQVASYGIRCVIEDILKRGGVHPELINDLPNNYWTVEKVHIFNEVFNESPFIFLELVFKKQYTKDGKTYNMLICYDAIDEQHKTITKDILKNGF